MPITNTLDLETLVSRMNEWASETDTKRGRMVRMLRSPKTNRIDLQAARLALLIEEAEAHA
ncbi:hypothetical protein IGX29_07880 [Streptomyces sp. H28]|uniref:hypothetical protein n=1 Tax=Streptomyces sp. H28 TaxID=2775865 RepID=UPI001786F5EB|nr:hypothetical protein [Streptomyces sp. H28]MBD9731739.1 hypothetical protein [Streptomyces sp. H28]